MTSKVHRISFEKDFCERVTEGTLRYGGDMDIWSLQGTLESNNQILLSIDNINPYWVIKTSFNISITPFTLHFICKNTCVTEGTKNEQNTTYFTLKFFYV